MFWLVFQLPLWSMVLHDGAGGLSESTGSPLQRRRRLHSLQARPPPRRPRAARPRASPRDRGAPRLPRARPSQRCPGPRSPHLDEQRRPRHCNRTVLLGEHPPRLRVVLPTPPPLPGEKGQQQPQSTRAHHRPYCRALTARRATPCASRRRAPQQQKTIMQSSHHVRKTDFVQFSPTSQCSRLGPPCPPVPAFPI